MTEIRGARSRRDIEGAAGLIAGAFDLLPGMGKGYADVYRDLAASDPALDPGCSRLAESGGEIVGHALAVPREMGIAGVPVPAGIVAFVAVREDLRGRGIGRALLRDAGAFLAARGAVVSHLSGDPGYYRRFGYVEVARRNPGRIPTSRLIPVGGRPGVREASIGDIAALHALSLEESRGATGGIRRTPGQWAWQLRTGYPLGYAACNEGLVGFRARRSVCLLAEAGGAPVGYARLLCGPGRILVHEAVGRDEAALDALYGRVRGLAEEAGARWIESAIPPDGRAASWLRERGAEMAEGMDPEALVKVLDCRRLADRIAPGMSERWRGSSLRDRSIRLEIATGVGGLILQTGPAGVRTSDPGPAIDWRVEVPEIGLTQMMLGARSYAGLLRGRPGSDPELEASISVLFPDRRPWIHLADML